MQYRPFEQAREFVRGLNLQNSAEWRTYASGGNKPVNIPYKPERTYRQKWQGMGDWLGTGTLATRNRVYRSYTFEILAAQGAKESAASVDSVYKASNRPPKSRRSVSHSQQPSSIGSLGYWRTFQGKQS